MDQTEAFTPELKKQIAYKKKLANKAVELSNEYREIKDKYPHVWADLTGYLERRLADNQDAIKRRTGGQLSRDGKSIEIVPLTGEQVLTLLDKSAEIEAVLEYLESKTREIKTEPKQK